MARASPFRDCVMNYNNKLMTSLWQYSVEVLQQQTSTHTCIFWNMIITQKKEELSVLVVKLQRSHPCGWTCAYVWVFVSKPEGVLSCRGMWFCLSVR